tara:strand:+ start:254 stop:3370 length:3117 start_codon:yes stop_codon:yes gene_type:complete
MTLADEYFGYVEKFCKSHGPKTIVLIQVGSFYEVYGILCADGSYKGALLKEFAAINDMVIAPKNMCIGKEDIFMAGFGLPQLDKYVKRLLEHGYTIPVFTQDIQGKNTTRSLACIYSPGTYFNNNDIIDFNENNNVNNGLSNNTICIWAHLSNSFNREPLLTIGLSIIDILTGKLINYEYSHPYIDSPSVYDELEKYIAIYNPSETIIITNNVRDYDGKYIDILINYANIHSDKFHKIYLNSNGGTEQTNNEFVKVALNFEKQKFQEGLIDKIYGIGSYLEKSEFRDYSFANQSLCFLLDFIYKHNPSLVKDIDYPVFENHSNKLVLANHSLKQLNIISDQRYNGKLSCVANLLNNCITNGGKRKFNYELLHPISDIETLNKSYDVVKHLLDSQFYKNIRVDLNDVRDIEKIERKLVLKNINPKDFAVLYNNLSSIQKLFKKISNSKENNQLYEYIKYYINYDIYDYCKTIMNFIENHFDLNKASLVVMEKINNYDLDKLSFISKKYSKDLNILFKNSLDSREQLNAISQFLSSIVGEYEKQKNNSKKKSKDDETCYVKIHETNKSDPLLLITKRRGIILKEIIDKIIKESGQYYNIPYVSSYSGLEETINLDLTSIEFKNHGSNNSNSIIFSNAINTIAYAIHNSKDVLINALTANYSAIVNDFSILNKKNNNLIIISRFVSLVDVCHVKAYNANKYNYSKPTIFDQDFNLSQNNETKSYVSFKKMRHCLIEHINNKELYVTNDLSIGSLINGILLYGTNAVGKTSFIKSIGISIILAQSGNYVPCEEFIYYPYNYLFTRILGNDNIFKGLSTFAVEMCELRTILKNATKNSIILGDELCSGTESTSALSIFMASLERLHKIESSFLFATHFHEILEYEELKNLEKLKTYHMTVIYDKAQKTLIYDRKLREGAGESMYGLEVCKSLDLPHDFIESAYNIRNKYLKTGGKLINNKKNKYNSKKLRDLCEICNVNSGTEIHHLQFQKNSSANGIINNEFNKNHKANLINICEICHNKIHNENKEYKISKSNNGYVLLEI